MSEQRHAPTTLIAEAASLLHLLGGMTPKHLVIVGGLVPPLLVPDSPQPHEGSADIDLSLSVAITEGGTSEYYRSIEQVIDPYFELFESGFRWRKRAGVGGIPLLIDFLGPEIEATILADGTLELADETAQANTGVRLRPFPLSSGRLVDDDAISTTVEDVELIYKVDTHADVEIRHAGPVGFLASKADALDSRDDPKDGYDIAWWCINAAATPEEVAQIVMGPTGYATEKSPELDPGNAAFEEDRNQAFLAVSGVVERLRSRLW